MRAKEGGENNGAAPKPIRQAAQERRKKELHEGIQGCKEAVGVRRRHDAHVDAGYVAAIEGSVGIERHLGDCVEELAGALGRHLVTHLVLPVPLDLERVEELAGRQAPVADLHHADDARRGVADDADRELLPLAELLDERRAAVAVQRARAGE